MVSFRLSAGRRRPADSSVNLCRAGRRPVVYHEEGSLPPALGLRPGHRVGRGTSVAVRVGKAPASVLSSGIWSGRGAPSGHQSSRCPYFGALAWHTSRAILKASSASEVVTTVRPSRTASSPANRPTQRAESKTRGLLDSHVHACASNFRRAPSSYLSNRLGGKCTPRLEHADSMAFRQSCRPIGDVTRSISSSRSASTTSSDLSKRRKNRIRTRNLDSASGVASSI
jgi:hypothetical protein